MGAAPLGIYSGRGALTTSCASAIYRQIQKVRTVGSVSERKIRYLGIIATPKAPPWPLNPAPCKIDQPRKRAPREWITFDENVSLTYERDFPNEIPN